ncbi:unnamed protein product [Dracunculus medinensis]|uniref:PHB domain-containing protein n=1 Tax=Dracunculus medinensis TaxID=318479 RepID=A0A0N4UMD4_DRAME|nr:unnamed protein product [Dracunculus medinensis]
MNRIEYTALNEKKNDDDWKYKYKSAFTYADYNDIDKMGYEAPKRYPIQNGPRYKKYTYSNEAWEEQIEDRDKGNIFISLVELFFLMLSFTIFIFTLPLSLFFSLKFVSDCERLVVLRLGRAQKIRGPGATVIFPCIDKCTKIDLRVNAFNVPPIQVITIDRGLVELGATVFLQVKDALAAVCAVQERNQSTRILAITILYRITSKRQVNDIISGNGRKALSENLKDELGEITSSWGVEVIKIELSDIKVIKEGENMALNLFNKILKSEFGSQILGTLSKTAHEFIAEQQQQQQQYESKQEENPSEDLIQFSSTVPNNVEFKNTNKTEINIDELINYLSMIIDERLVTTIGQVFQIRCKDFGDFYLNLKNGSGKCMRGLYAGADVVFELNQETLRQIIKQKISPVQAYLNGSLKITTGSLKSASKFSVIFERIAHLI